MCAIAGCYNTPHAPDITRYGLYMQQHRGQEWVGMVSSDGHNFHPERPPLRLRGLVMEALTDTVMQSLMGFMAMGHLRYSTQGASELNNAQPHAAYTSEGPIFFESNGDIVNCHALRMFLIKEGFTFYSQNDGEVIVKLVAYLYRELRDWISALREAKRRLVGTFSGVLMTRDRMFLLRDHLENRPFCYTQSSDGAVFFASESAALDSMTAEYSSFDGSEYQLREVSGDEIIELADGKLNTYPDPPPEKRTAHCIFEMIYFSRPESTLFGIQAKEFRRRLGERLVIEAKPSGDIVSPVPDSSNEAALAVARVTGIPLEPILYRHHYTGRTFIAPSQTLRDFGVRLKFNPDRRMIRGKRIVLIDDSIVRGTTMKKLVGMVKRYHPQQVTLLITCPLIMHPCYYGIDIKGGLVAADLRGNVEAIRQYLGLDGEDRLHFMSMPGLRSCVAEPAKWCFACLSGEYPTDVSEYVPPER